ncbi:MAG: zinc ribbon domain-containing protein [Candidatus Kariarchaeaceae archaeon]
MVQLIHLTAPASATPSDRFSLSHDQPIALIWDEGKTSSLEFSMIYNASLSPSSALLFLTELEVTSSFSDNNFSNHTLSTSLLEGVNLSFNFTFFSRDDLFDGVYYHRIWAMLNNSFPSDNFSAEFNFDWTNARETNLLGLSINLIVILWFLGAFFIFLLPILLIPTVYIYFKEKRRAQKKPISHPQHPSKYIKASSKSSSSQSDIPTYSVPLPTCPSCGSKLLDNTRFCVNCGTKIEK